MCVVYHTSKFEIVEEVGTDDEIEKRIISSLNIILKNEQIWIPDSGDNITGWPRDIVPNIVHYVLLETYNISYVHMLSLFSAVRIQQPDRIIIHCDCDKIDDGDENWARLIDSVNITNDVTVHINQIEKPTEISNEGFANFHIDDTTRYQVLSKYGGIYLGNDVFVCQPLNVFFKYEFTLHWDQKKCLGSQVLIGNRNARFLKLALHANDLQIRSILYKYPHLVHRVKDQFGTDRPEICPYFFKENHDDWQIKFYTSQMVDGEGCLGGETNRIPKAAPNDALIKSLNNTFGEMGRYFLFGGQTFSEESTENTSYSDGNGVGNDADENGDEDDN